MELFFKIVIFSLFINFFPPFFIIIIIFNPFPDPWISSADKRAKNRMIVMMSRCLRYLYEKRPPSPECMQHFMSLRPGGSPVINMS